MFPGFVCFFGSSLISWKFKKQTTVSRSSSESEYRTLASLICELQWLSYLFKDLHINFQQLASVYCDNKSAIYIAHNPTFHEKRKHIGFGWVVGYPNYFRFSLLILND